MTSADWCIALAVDNLLATDEAGAYLMYSATQFVVSMAFTNSKLPTSHNTLLLGIQAFSTGDVLADLSHSSARPCSL